MKKLMRYSVITLLIFAIVGLAGCDKDDNGNGADKTSLLTAHIWKFDNASTTSTDPLIQAMVTMMSTLVYTDATMNFNADGTYAMTIKNPLTQQDETDSGTWEWNSDESKVIIDKGTEDEAESTIVTLTSDVLEHTMTEEEDDLGIIELTMRWVK